ncbi:bifunctional 4-hydroxy-2-oxoglutarate aldolase/2-dehydro-3-deoxy-phosphogluconate aldolase [Arthrobacter sp. H5]|uniref:bifunctional 4-hydroxy-2-oxoglutarate aldolase/2-dehydro-3-deoxy-phosphogluconate aldolase n=1 Tax=Arthrobacter sp. H5 TaxID=1267973 RepID=UPI000488843F|nr:bifunctional 4-hydroxy-2-oxoglutarate aldolase/2-dehydro-3-deoxy-phosphogluconate aldolase [Arthrobacter sp. H5]
MSADIDVLIQGQPVMAILRNMDAKRAVELASRAWDLGIDLVEVPIQSPDAIPSLEAVVRAGAERGKAVGSGTIVTAEQVRVSRDAGAAFTVAPGLDEEVVRLCREDGMPHLPGVSTPSEIQAAVRLGCHVVKAFPASVLGTEWFKAMQGPFPAVTFVATGGIDASNAAAFLQAGARTVAVGSALADERQLDLIAEIIAGRLTTGN